jgi:hypothetical protein
MEKEEAGREDASWKKNESWKKLKAGRSKMKGIKYADEV